MKSTNLEHERQLQQRIRNDPWLYLTIVGWVSLGIVVYARDLSRSVELTLWALALGCFFAALTISLLRGSSNRKLSKTYKLLSSALDTLDPDKITAANLIAMKDPKFTADPSRKALVEEGFALADRMRKNIPDNTVGETPMNQNTADQLFGAVQNIFMKYTGQVAIPSGWSLSGGIYFFEFHMRQGVFGSKRISGKIFNEINNMIRANGLNTIGSGMRYVGNRWWFFHFFFLEDQRDVQPT